MGKSIILLVSALSLMSLLNLTSSHNLPSSPPKDRFFVEGKVYCDTCRVQFFTKVSKFLEGATVKLICKKIEGGSVTFTKEAVTDKTGSYRIEADGDHEEELCEVSLVKSNDSECGEISLEKFEHMARVSITGNSGITNTVRHANPLAFLKKEKLPECKEILRELGFDDAGILV